MAFNSPLSCIVAIEICLISGIHHFPFDTRVASVILLSSPELAEVVLEMHHILTDTLWCFVMNSHTINQC